MAAKRSPSGKNAANIENSSPIGQADGATRAAEVTQELHRSIGEVQDTEESNSADEDLDEVTSSSPDAPGKNPPLPIASVNNKNEKDVLPGDDPVINPPRPIVSEKRNAKKEKDVPPGETRRQTFSLSDICKMIIFLVLAGVCLVAAILIGPAEPEIKSDLDFVKIYENTLSRLQFILTNQTDRFWRILKNRGLAHLRNTNPRQPLVLLLAAPPAAHDIVDCLATKLAQELDAKHKRNLALVDGAKEKRKPGEKVKKDMDELLIEKFQNGHRAALIRHLELLPPPSPLLFYSYCDDQNAPHKHVAIIFTVHLPEEPDLSLPAKEAEGAVEKYLANQVWAKEDQDSVAALLSRVADTVALMNGETRESVQSFCNNIENYKFSK